MKGLILFIIAFLSLLIILPISIIYGIFKNKLDLFKYAVSIDQVINAIGGELLDKLFLKEKNLFQFGNMDKTISYNLGKNKKFNNLNKFGLLVCNLLNKLDKKHVERAFDDDV